MDIAWESFLENQSKIKLFTLILGTRFKIRGVLLSKKQKFNYCCRKSLKFGLYENIVENKSFELGICTNCGLLKVITSSGNKLGKGAAVEYWEKYKDRSKKIELNEYNALKISFPDFRFYDVAGLNKQAEYFLSTGLKTGREKETELKVLEL